MRYGRLFLAGDAAHIVPPTGAKGLNLAVNDVRLLAAGADRLLPRRRRPPSSTRYSDTALRRVWRAQDFSNYMTTLLHDLGGGPFESRLQLARLEYLSSAREAAAEPRRELRRPAGGRRLLTMNVAYEKGLHELGDGLYAYLQPDGGWGWSNAGLITAEGTSLLVDTLYDLPLTREMLDAMAVVTAAHPIDAAMNTHANPDHCFGNELLPTATTIYASRATAGELAAISPELLSALKSATDLPEDLAAFVEHAFGPFEFEGITVRPPSETFDDRLELRVGDRDITLIELGPAHTARRHDRPRARQRDRVRGRPAVHRRHPDRVGRPGQLACGMRPDPRARRRRAGARTRPGDRLLRGPRRAAISALRAASRPACGSMPGWTPRRRPTTSTSPRSPGWSDPERIAANVAAAYREFDPSLPAPAAPELLMRMAAWMARH